MPQPGDFYLTKITGRGGAFIRVAQWAIGDMSQWSHAGILLDHDEVAEAMPGGLEINPLSKYDDKEIIFSDFNLTDDQRRGIISQARGLEGTPYAWLGYLYIGLTAFNKCPQWVRDQVSNSKSLICSQAVDYVYTMSGCQLFHDHRTFLDVTPGDLARAIHAG